MREPEHRRWRIAFRGVARSAAQLLAGGPRRWMAGAVRDLMTNGVEDPWLRSELAVDLHGTNEFAMPEMLPEWTAREVWHLADSEGLPMAYVWEVTQLPDHIDALVDTAQLVIDCRRTAMAHREQARAYALERPSLAPGLNLPPIDSLTDLAVRAQLDAADRWRGMARRLLLAAPRVVA